MRGCQSGEKSKKRKYSGQRELGRKRQFGVARKCANRDGLDWLSGRVEQGRRNNKPAHTGERLDYPRGTHSGIDLGHLVNIVKGEKKKPWQTEELQRVGCRGIRRERQLVKKPYSKRIKCRRKQERNREWNRKNEPGKAAGSTQNISTGLVGKNKVKKERKTIGDCLPGEAQYGTSERIEKRKGSAHRRV